MIYKMLINGEWTDAIGGKTKDVVNPATHEVIATVPYGFTEDAEAAVEAAHAAQPGWAAMTAYQRGAILRRVAELIVERKEELARILTQEGGKPLGESRGEWQACADLFDWFSEEGKRAYGRSIPARKGEKRLFAVPTPMGVVATITAWNFPAYLAARKWSAALAAGCTVVGRPADATPMSAIALANIIVEAGIPKGVFNLVVGKSSAMGEVFLKSPKVDKLSFTGSGPVGEILMRGAADRIRRLSLELGGSAPVIIFGDVDVEEAAKQAVSAKFRNNGQVCICPARWYAHSSIYKQFVEAVAREAKALKVGNGLEDGVQVGPLVTASSCDDAAGFVEDAVKRGGKVVAGGGRPAGLDKGNFFSPTVVADATDDMRVTLEEIFGPVMPIYSFETEEEVIRRANDTPFGLAGYLLTKDLSRALRVSEALKFGIVGVNDLVPATAEAPFGPMKESGFGREGSQEGLHEYMEIKFISIGL
jgi:succinate-semialdehyde dehydrogenase / glutarate-semialdehyde dehydrogenase